MPTVANDVERAVAAVTSQEALEIIGKLLVSAEVWALTELEGCGQMGWIVEIIGRPELSPISKWVM